MPIWEIAKDQPKRIDSSMNDGGTRIYTLSADEDSEIDEDGDEEMHDEEEEASEGEEDSMNDEFQIPHQQA